VPGDCSALLDRKKVASKIIFAIGDDVGHRRGKIVDVTLDPSALLARRVRRALD
jgi:hypothetical protein